VAAEELAVPTLAVLELPVLETLVAPVDQLQQPVVAEALVRLAAMDLDQPPEATAGQV
jgi:hypothetical protein